MFNFHDFGSVHEFRSVHAQHVFNTMRLLFLQFLFTFGSVSFVAFNDAAYLYTVNNAASLISMGGLGGLFTVIYMCFMSKRKTELQLAIFTVFETMLICAATTMYGRETVLMAMLAMIGIVAGLGTYAITTSNDHTGLIGPLFSGLTCILMMGFVNFFLRSEIVRMFELFVGTLLFFGYVVFDVQYYLSRCTKHMYNREDLHIEAALNIYLDAVNIFVRLLEIFGSKDKKKKD